MDKPWSIERWEWVAWSEWRYTHIAPGRILPSIRHCQQLSAGMLVWHHCNIIGYCILAGFFIGHLHCWMVFLWCMFFLACQWPMLALCLFFNNNSSMQRSSLPQSTKERTTYCILSCTQTVARLQRKKNVNTITNCYSGFFFLSENKIFLSVNLTETLTFNNLSQLTFCHWLQWTVIC